MRRRIRQAINNTLNEVIHNKVPHQKTVIPETGTVILVERKAPGDFVVTMSIRGDDLANIESYVGDPTVNRRY